MFYLKKYSSDKTNGLNIDSYFLRATSSEGTRGENKCGGSTFILQFVNVLYMADICAKFENLYCRSFSRE